MAKIKFNNVIRKIAIIVAKFISLIVAWIVEPERKIRIKLQLTAQTISQDGWYALIIYRNSLYKYDKVSIMCAYIRVNIKLDSSLRGKMKDCLKCKKKLAVSLKIVW